MGQVAETASETVGLLGEPAAGRTGREVSQQLTIGCRIQGAIEAGGNQRLGILVGNHRDASRSSASSCPASGSWYTSAKALRARKSRSFAAFSVISSAAAVSAKESPW